MEAQGILEARQLIHGSGISTVLVPFDYSRTLEEQSINEVLDALKNVKSSSRKVVAVLNKCDLPQKIDMQVLKRSVEFLMK